MYTYRRACCSACAASRALARAAFLLPLALPLPLLVPPLLLCSPAEPRVWDMRECSQAKMVCRGGRKQQS